MEGKANGSQHFAWSTVFNSANSGDSSLLDEITTALGSTNWRGLSRSEWDYLLNTRTTVWHRYALIAGNGTNKTKQYLLMFPDDFKADDWKTETMGTQPSNFDNSTATIKTYTDAQFTAMQNAGILILPAAGQCYDERFSYVGWTGYYWSTTSKDSNYAYNLKFVDGTISTTDKGHKSSTYEYKALNSVRLVYPL